MLGIYWKKTTNIIMLIFLLCYILVGLVQMQIDMVTRSLSNCYILCSSAVHIIFYVCLMWRAGHTKGGGYPSGASRFFFRINTIIVFRLNWWIRITAPFSINIKLSLWFILSISWFSMVFLKKTKPAIKVENLAFFFLIFFQNFNFYNQAKPKNWWIF